MKSITLYEKKDTPIHRLDPLTKLLYSAVIITSPLILGWKPALAVTIALSATLLLRAKMLRKTLPMLGFVFFVLATVVIIQSMFRAGNVTPLLRVGPAVFYREGFVYAMGIVLNVINVVTGFALLILTTKPSDLVEALVRVGFSPRLGYVVASVFQIIPQMGESMATIADAQRSRGMETQGRLVTRVKAFFPLIGPVIMNSLIATKERAVALEVRGFSSRAKRTFLAPPRDSPVDHRIKAVLIAALALAVVGRVALWLF